MTGRATDAAAPRVAVVGAGFAGLEVARGLARAPVRLTVVDRQNHHLFQPLLYQVATAGLGATEIAGPVRSILRDQANATVLMADVRAVDAPAGRLVLGEGELPFDYLVLATGAGHSYLGHDAWAAHAPGLKSLEDALDIRRRVLLAFERAEAEADPARREAWLTFVVIGAGPTGVEMAGALAEMGRHTLARDFRRIDPRRSRVVLLEGSPRVLQSFPEDLSARARQQLEGLGVQVRTGARVTAVDEGGVWLGEERLEARTLVWAAGVAASPLGASLGVPLDRAGRVRVERDLSVPGHPRVFVVGDLAAVEQDGQPVPGVAPAAMQMGRHAADAIRRDLAGQPRRPFRYVDKGSLATIGRRSGVAQFGRVHLAGFVAWLAWLLVHVYFLIGFRNRLVVMLDWARAYFTYERAARLILGEGRSQPPQSGG